MSNCLVSRPPVCNACRMSGHPVRNGENARTGPPDVVVNGLFAWFVTRAKRAAPAHILRRQIQVQVKWKTTPENSQRGKVKSQSFIWCHLLKRIHWCSYCRSCLANLLCAWERRKLDSTVYSQRGGWLVLTYQVNLREKKQCHNQNVQSHFQHIELVMITWGI